QLLKHVITDISGYFSVLPKYLLLVSPVHPVTEGASVTLSCRRRGENNISDVIFYHHDKLIQNDSRGELKISAVSQSDEGFYKCEHSGEVSPQSWMAVKAKVCLTCMSVTFLSVSVLKCEDTSWIKQSITHCI
uniref:Ig-like domain-containing protein n=1 Tax=Poecilia mexicana TaxID=48701 RepID=A0A3B3XCU1_9TELE